jgi:hypothetical protein
MNPTTRTFHSHFLLMQVHYTDIKAHNVFECRSCRSAIYEENYIPDNLRCLVLIFTLHSGRNPRQPPSIKRNRNTMGKNRTNRQGQQNEYRETSNDQSMEATLCASYVTCLRYHYLPSSATGVVLTACLIDAMRTPCYQSMALSAQTRIELQQSVLVLLREALDTLVCHTAAFPLVAPGYEPIPTQCRKDNVTRCKWLDMAV